MHKILIVDDDVQVIQQVKAILSALDYQVGFITRADFLFARLDAEQFDLVLLDVNMPKKDGYTLLKEIKQNEKHKKIHVIMLTGETDHQFLANCFERGATDFITKPIVDLLLKARVKNTLSIISEKEGELKALNLELEERVKVRTSELEESLETLQKTQDRLIIQEKMASLGSLTAGVAHEINTPVGVSITSVSYLQKKIENLEEMFTANKLRKAELRGFLQIAHESTNLILSSLTKGAKLIQKFKSISVDDTIGKPSRFLLNTFVLEIIKPFYPKLEKYEHQIHVSCDSALEVTSYPSIISQIIDNFIMNSIYHGFDELEKRNIRLELSKVENYLCFVYKDDGKGIPAVNLPKIFDPLFTTKRGDSMTGLGMHIVYNLVTYKLKGEIVCDSEEGKGVCFTIKIPIKMS